ncbi:polysaccharide biosynthesis/export family protein [Dysgonomonas sp. 520]|uniref:polysaccharide biosynthesis/export family protein n=1 Tax=Dysgonomonas sp. 520 TaxID=2302931 RepID=UPI002105C48D|nr:polysaccharide biosynthesis/export family protein [Dysgonomonas sp. 520]
MKVLPVFFALLFFFSCNTYKELPYLKDAETLSGKELKENALLYDAKIKPKDILSITVNAQSPAVVDFNLPLVSNDQYSAVSTTTQSVTLSSGSLQNYVVSNEGEINFPVLGKLKIGGMTKTEAQNFIASLIYPKYLTENPIVNIRFLNYKVMVAGEVSSPGEYSTLNEKMTIFEALTRAGDLTIYGRRDNVLLVRTKDNGELEIHRINLQDKNLLLNKDIYYLQQNDYLFVEANAAKGNSSRFGSFETITMSALSIMISVISIILR